MVDQRPTNKQIASFFKDKKEVPAPLTDALIVGGHVQHSGGYIEYASKEGVQNPTQYWHLMESWSARSKEDQVFGKTIRCGELIVWMTEVSQAVPTEELQKLVDDVLRLHNELGYDRAYVQGNQLIQDVCFDRMIEVVLKNTAE